MLLLRPILVLHRSVKNKTNPNINEKKRLYVPRVNKHTIRASNCFDDRASALHDCISWWSGKTRTPVHILHAFTAVANQQDNILSSSPGKMCRYSAFKAAHCRPRWLIFLPWFGRATFVIPGAISGVLSVHSRECLFCRPPPSRLPMAAARQKRSGFDKQPTRYILCTALIVVFFF